MICAILVCENLSRTGTVIKSICCSEVLDRVDHATSCITQRACLATCVEMQLTRDRIDVGLATGAIRCCFLYFLVTRLGNDINAVVAFVDIAIFLVSIDSSVAH